jgi:NDP-sugar pyrophosphorylase family protein
MSAAEPLPPVCLLAGGLGTRLGDAAQGRPKALVEVAGEPFLFHQLRHLRRQGAERVVLCIGFRGELIEEAIGDGAAFGLTVTYSHDGATPIGTGGAVRQALPQLGDAFLVTFADTYLPDDHRAAWAAFRASPLPALMCVLHNEGRWDTSNVVMDGDLVRYDKHDPPADADWIDYGLSVLSAEALERAPQDLADLGEIMSWLSRHDLLAGHVVTERFHEIGSPEALADTDVYLRDLIHRMADR